MFTWRQGRLLPNNTRRKEQQTYNIMDALWRIPISSDAIWSQCSPRGIWMQITRTPQQPKRSRRLERRHIGLRIRWYHKGSQCKPWRQPDKATSKSTQSNLKFNSKKLNLRKSEVMGYVLTSEGLKPDPDKIQAVSKMPKPTCKQQTLSLLGFVNYLAKFLPRLSEIAHPVRELTTKNRSFV